MVVCCYLLYFKTLFLIRIEISKNIETLIILNVLNQLMAHEDIRQTFLLKLYEKSVSDSVRDFDRYEIGSDIGLLDKTQTDNLVDELIDRG